MKIQFEYDLLNGQFLNVQLRPGKNNDKTYGTICLKTVEAGDLCLRDLGYFDLGGLLYLTVEVEYTHLYQEP